tara:strand:+ start:3204 stop:3980 length:777 start_codon:yes stop_codon:yes gene_type:complete
MRVSNFISGLAGVAAMFGLSVVATPALSADMRAGDFSAFVATYSEREITSTISVSAFESIAMGYLTPANLSVAFGALPGETLSVNALNGMSGGLALVDTFDIAGKYTADIHGGRFGLYGGYSDRPSTLSLQPDSAWNFGASLGYAGFYVRGGISDMTAIGFLQNVEGWEAGFGYETGNLDLRLTYAASQSANDLGSAAHQIDSKQWTLGGDYKISSSLRLNADAFYDMRSSGLPALFAAPALATPQGTGARVGVQLRF